MIQRFRPLTALAGMVLCAASAVAQGPETEIKPLGPDPLDGPERVVAPVDQMQQELRELFRQVEVRLREIDRLLSDASAGDTAALDGVGEAGIDKLLDRSREGATKSIQDIDRILEIAEQMGSQSQSAGACEKPGDGSGQSPIDKAGQQRTQREATPEAPGEQAGKEGEEPKPEGKEPKPGQEGDVPRDGTAQDDPFADNREGAQPPGSERAGPADPNGLDRWGDLPITVRDVFRTEGGSDLPPRYRDWIDSYYRRLSDHR